MSHFSCKTKTKKEHLSCAELCVCPNSIRACMEKYIICHFECRGLRKIYNYDTIWYIFMVPRKKSISRRKIRTFGYISIPSAIQSGLHGDHGERVSVFQPPFHWFWKIQQFFFKRQSSTLRYADCLPSSDFLNHKVIQDEYNGLTRGSSNFPPKNKTNLLVLQQLNFLHHSLKIRNKK